MVLRESKLHMIEQFHNIDAHTAYIISKLYQVFKDGYRPTRGNESYAVKLKNGAIAYNIVNCFGHIFNLRNQQFDDYQIKPYRMYGHFIPAFYLGSKEKSAQQMFDFIKETGLKIEECAPHQTMTDFKSWKIALYFSNKDFHYLLEESPQKWSSKIGFEKYVEHIDGLTPPKKYRNQINRFNRKDLLSPTDNLSKPAYHLYGTYKITNPHADENNRYVQGLQDRMM